MFEGERAYGGEIFELTKHSQRLYDGAKTMDFTIPYSVAEIDQACRDTVKANKLTDCYVRPIAWRGSEKMGVSAQATKIHLAVAAWDWGSYFPMEERLKGMRLTIAKYRRPDPATAPAKTKAAGLYMICTIEKHRAERAGYRRRADVRLARPRRRVHRRQHLLHQGRRAAYPDARLLPRRHHARTVIGLAKKRGLQVVERTIMPDELGTFSECFLTGTAAEVTPVAEIGEHRYKPGKICETLINDYTAAVQPKKQAAE